jgi:hypothetical protein
METKSEVPPYVWDLLMAFIEQTPLNFGKHEVPIEIQQFLTKAVETGTLKQVPLGDEIGN